MSENKSDKYFSKVITKKQSTDAGMALILILLLIAYFTQNNIYYKITIPVLIINMTVPMFFYPFAFLWFGFSKIMGTIMSKIILTVLYIVIVIPMGTIRLIIGKDSLLLKKFKKNNESVLKTRNIIFSSNDIENPY